MINRLTVYNIKGGVGKTRIALNLALMIGWGIVTNDQYSVIENVLPPSKRIILSPAGNEEQSDELKYPSHIPLIFDMGGKEDTRAIAAMQQSAYVLVPVLADKGDLQLGLDFIQEIQSINPDILIIVNQTKPGQFQQVSRVLKHIYPKLPAFEIKASTAMSRIVTEKRSIAEIMKNNSLFRRHYSKINEQFQAIINYCGRMKNERLGPDGI